VALPLAACEVVTDDVADFQTLVPIDIERHAAPIPQATFGTYYQVFANPMLAQCVAEILDAEPTDQLWKSTALETLGLIEIGVSNGYDQLDREHPHCGVALRNATGPQGLDITGIEVFSALEVIDFTGMRYIPDLSPLGGLHNLMRIYLFGTRITSLEALKRTQWKQKIIVNVENERVAQLTIPELAQWGILVEGNTTNRPMF
jgi:hypothetical protein